MIDDFAVSRNLRISIDSALTILAIKRMLSQGHDPVLVSILTNNAITSSLQPNGKEAEQVSSMGATQAANIAITQSTGIVPSASGQEAEATIPRSDTIQDNIVRFPAKK